VHQLAARQVPEVQLAICLDGSQQAAVQEGQLLQLHDCLASHGTTKKAAKHLHGDVRWR
jgi:hypothetical protein